MMDVETTGDKRDTARRKLMRRAVFILSRGNQTRLELFGSQFDNWPAVIMESMFDAA
jgi:hypothetical protein